MLTGRYGDTTGRPYIEGRLVIPRLNILADVSFIIDTGADCTVLMPLDGGRMGIDYGQLRNAVDSVGVGGLSRDFTEPAIVAFSDGASIYAYSLIIRIS